jgi:hypothetical protein
MAVNPFGGGLTAFEEPENGVHPRQIELIARMLIKLDIFPVCVRGGQAGHIVTLGGAEFAEEIVNSIDLYRAARNAPSLGHFIDDVRSVLRRSR